MTAHQMRARRRLAERFREHRERAGLTGTQLAEVLGWRQPKVSKLETGRQLPSDADLEAWAQATGADRGELLAMLERARAEYATFKQLYAEAGGADRLQDAIGLAEAAATRIAKYQPVLILGILQTADYAREMLHLPGGPADSGAATEDQISRMIASRLRRQALLHEPGRDITLLMGEGALRTRLASAAVMQAQLEHIARLAETLTTATIGIVPFSVSAPIAVLNGWDIRDDAVTIETDGGDLNLADPEVVGRYWRNTQLLLEAATTEGRAAELCRSIAAELADDSAP